MNKAQKARMQKAGWKVGTAADVLGLNQAEAALVEAKLSLGDVVRTVRQRMHLSQAGLAKLMGSSQSRVAKVENRDPEISLELQMKAIFAADPGARRDFHGLIKKWSAGRQTAKVAESTGGVRGRR
jgi:DNA-binding XRE family transcriptional regulator